MKMFPSDVTDHWDGALRGLSEEAVRRLKDQGITPEQVQQELTGWRLDYSEELYERMAEEETDLLRDVLATMVGMPEEARK